MKRRSLLLVLGALGAVGFGMIEPSNAVVWLLGCGIGWVLVHYRFGFSSAYRRLILQRDPAAFYPQLLLVSLLLLATAVFLAVARPLGISLELSRTPVSLPFLVGAFLFGVGMQIARGCGCGTLASASRAGPTFVVTLLGLMFGVFLGTLHLPAVRAMGLPSLQPLVLLDAAPLPVALVAQLVLVALVLAAVIFGTGRPPAPAESAVRPLYRAALWLAAFAAAVLVVTGQPWRVLWGLGLASAHAAQALGWDPQTSPFWATPARQALLSSPLALVRQDAIVIDLGLIFGAVATSLWEGRASWGADPLPPGALVGRGAGGLLMGYGGFLASGCNVNGFLGGVMSFGLHGWIWLAAALAGSAVWLRWCNPARRSWPDA